MPQTHSTLRSLAIGAARRRADHRRARRRHGARLSARCSRRPEERHPQLQHRRSCRGARSRRPTSYEVQVDNDASASPRPDFTAKTTNTKAVPTKALIPGKNFWRVRVRRRRDHVRLGRGQLHRGPGRPRPIPLVSRRTAPCSGSRRARRCCSGAAARAPSPTRCRSTRDADMIGAKVYTTKTTSLVVPDPLTVGDWYWRVTADKGDRPGQPALGDVARFDISAAGRADQITYPPNDVDQAIEDVVLDWTPVPGAAYYDVQVALDPDFNNITDSVTNVRSTRYSPPVTLEQRPVLVARAGRRPGRPADPVDRVAVRVPARSWPGQARRRLPARDARPRPGRWRPTKPFFQWTPVQHASIYELQMADDENFSTDVRRRARRPRRPTRPRGTASCGVPRRRPDRLLWRVRPIDDARTRERRSAGPVLRRRRPFTWTATAVVDAAPAWHAVRPGVTGPRIAGRRLPDRPGPAAARDDLCAGVPGHARVLAGTPCPDANVYRVYFAQDDDFTTTEIADDPVATNTIASSSGDATATAAARARPAVAYYWHVTAVPGLAGLRHRDPCPTIRRSPARRAVPQGVAGRSLA